MELGRRMSRYDGKGADKVLTGRFISQREAGGYAGRHFIQLPSASPPTLFGRRQIWQHSSRSMPHCAYKA